MGKQLKINNRMKSITIILFDTPAPDIVLTLDCPEVKRRPPEIAKLVRSHIESLDTAVIRTWSAIPLEVVGEMIDDGKLSEIGVNVLLDGKSYCYDSEGCLVDWAYGVFNYSS